jgi:putative pyoverdin transport system ATP-binding/permease protein
VKTTAVIFCLVLAGAFSFVSAQDRQTKILQADIDKEVRQAMETGNIPGLGLVIIKNGRVTTTVYGYADLQHRTPVTVHTLFELGSCSKAFTALALARLIRNRRVRPEDLIVKYIPGLRFRYKDSVVDVTVAQVMHHTAGIPWSTISMIPQTGREDALEQTVGQLRGLRLNRLPGTKFEYATVDYDILALVIQRVTHRSFESYVQDSVIDQLGLFHTGMGYATDPGSNATGYKIGFFVAREYPSPVFRGNNAAGYVISDVTDIAKWLQFQLGLSGDTGLYRAALVTHQRDETVPLHDMDSYAMGWQVSLNGSGEIYHDGRNPNFTSYMVFRSKDSTGVGVLANSNSTYTDAIGNKIMKMLEGVKIEKEYDPGDGNDKEFSIASIILAAYILGILIYIGACVAGIARRKRVYEGYGHGKLARVGLLFLALTPFSIGVYFLPAAVYQFSWRAMIIWTPVSFYTMLMLLPTAVAVTCCAYILSLGFPSRNKFKRMIPKLLLVSILSGFANMVMIILITSSLDSEVKWGYLVFYYLLALSAYLAGRRFVQISLVRFTMGIIYELRLDLTDRIFFTSYQKFEKIDRGFIYTVMNDDVTTIGESTNMFVVVATSIFTAIGALLFMASLAFWAAVLTFSLILTLTSFYYVVSRINGKYFEDARNARNVFMRLLNGMIDGFKEICISANKKKGYKEDIAISANEYKVKTSAASIGFINASIVGEGVLIVVMGAVAFAFPKLFPFIKVYTLVSFLIVLLYLIGPVNTILNSIPTLMQLRIAINRINTFKSGVAVDPEVLVKAIVPVVGRIESLKVEGISFEYRDEDRPHPFSLGPIDLEIGRGEILFIVGGNGSGKSTLAKLLTGLYTPDGGRFLINGGEVSSAELGEHFSAVFSPMYIFKKLYNVRTAEKSGEIQKYLKMLDLDGKVSIRDNAFSTIELSQGQRKRLALLQCYLEDAPIYLFDEWAADQDPTYRQFFYRKLLPEMKAAGKIVIAITHDEHYFNVADRIYVMDDGKLDIYSSTNLWALQPVIE